METKYRMQLEKKKKKGGRGKEKRNIYDFS